MNIDTVMEAVRSLLEYSTDPANGIKTDGSGNAEVTIKDNEAMKYYVSCRFFRSCNWVIVSPFSTSNVIRGFKQWGAANKVFNYEKDKGNPVVLLRSNGTILKKGNWLTLEDDVLHNLKGMFE